MFVLFVIRVMRLMGHVARVRETSANTKFHKDRLKELVVNVRVILKSILELWSDDVQCHLAPDWGPNDGLLRTRTEGAGPVEGRRCFSG